MRITKTATLVLALMIPSAALAQTKKRHPACPPPPDRGLAPEDRRLKQWEHVLLLDNSMSMVKPSRIWESTREAFAGHAARIPLGSRVSFYVFNSRAQEYNPRLEEPVAQTDYLDAEGRKNLVARIKAARPVARVTPLTFYLKDLLRRHVRKDNPALGYSFYIYTDGSDESCSAKHLPRFQRHIKRHQKLDFSKQDCERMKSEIEARVLSERKANSFFIWTVTRPEKPCTSDADCGAGRCITLSNGEKRCVNTPSEQWQVSLGAVQKSHKLDRGATAVKELPLARARVVKKADFPALVVTSWEEDGTRVLDFEPPSLILSGKATVHEIKTRVTILSGVKDLPQQVKGHLTFETCWGKVSGLRRIPLLFKLSQTGCPLAAVTQHGKKKTLIPWRKGKKYPNLRHLKRGPMRATVHLTRTAGGVDPYAGITRARLLWGSERDPRSLKCKVVNKQGGRMAVTCPATSRIKRGWRPTKPRTYKHARLVLEDTTGRFSFSARSCWLRAHVRVPAKQRSGGGLPIWLICLGLLALAFIAWLIVSRLRYPPAQGKLFLRRPEGGPVELFASQVSRFSAPETRLSLSQLFDGAGPGEMTMTMDRGGLLTLDPQGQALTWNGEAMDGPKVIGQVDSDGNLIRGRGTLGLEGHGALELISDSDLSAKASAPG